jgi:hypothetical protein
MGYGVDCQIWIQSIGKRFFSTPQCPDRLWWPFSLLSNGYWILSGDKVKLTTHLHLVPISRMVELYLQSHISLHCAALNYLSKGTTLPLPLAAEVSVQLYFLKFDLTYPGRIHIYQCPFVMQLRLHRETQHSITTGVWDRLQQRPAGIRSVSILRSSVQWNVVAFYRLAKERERFGKCYISGAYDSATKDDGEGLAEPLADPWGHLATLSVRLCTAWPDRYGPPNTPNCVVQRRNRLLHHTAQSVSGEKINAIVSLKIV